MTIERWAPFSAFTSLEQEMHSLLDRVGARPWLEGFGWKPDTDIYRDGRSLVVQVELAGVDPQEDIAVDVEANVLQITGRRWESSSVDEADRYVTERRYGSFRRDVMLPDGVEAEAVCADYDNGVLTVRVSLPEMPGGEDGSQRAHIDVAVSH